MSKPSIVIGITGGISTGKSTFAKALQEKTGAKLFDADRAAHELTDRHPEVRESLRAHFGSQIFSSRGELNRAALRAIIFADKEEKRALEQILHPRIRAQWATEAEESRKAGKIFLADIPLLYETNGETLCDRVVVVACSHEIQLERLVARTSLSRQQAMEIVTSQLPLEEKVLRADHVVWNNGAIGILAAQAEMLARFWQ